MVIHKIKLCLLLKLNIYMLKLGILNTSLKCLCTNNFILISYVWDEKVAIQAFFDLLYMQHKEVAKHTWRKPSTSICMIAQTVMIS